MTFFRKIHGFWSDERGAVTVDWVVLTAAIIGLAIIVLSIVEGGVVALGENINVALSNMVVGEQFLDQGNTGNTTSGATSSGSGTQGTSGAEGTSTGGTNEAPTGFTSNAPEA